MNKSLLYLEVINESTAFVAMKWDDSSFFSGKEIFVGLGQGRRTNERGASAVVDAFPEYNVTPVRIDGQVQLKSLVSMAGKDIIAVGNSQNANRVMQVKINESVRQVNESKVTPRVVISLISKPVIEYKYFKKGQICLFLFLSDV